MQHTLQPTQHIPPAGWEEVTSPKHGGIHWQEEQQYSVFLYFLCWHVWDNSGRCHCWNGLSHFNVVEASGSTRKQTEAGKVAGMGSRIREVTSQLDPQWSLCSLIDEQCMEILVSLRPKFCMSPERKNPISQPVILCYLVHWPRASQIKGTLRKNPWEKILWPCYKYMYI